MPDATTPSEHTEAVIKAHREGHERRGNTFAVYFPPECPWETYLQATDDMANLVYGIEREGWDCFAFSVGGECDLVPIADNQHSAQAGGSDEPIQNTDSEQHEAFCSARTPDGPCSCRAPRRCPRCGVICRYDGWDHVHPNGLGLGEPTACTLVSNDPSASEADRG
jgi:hypothetical protein